jgi:hypothetical protein
MNTNEGVPDPSPNAYPLTWPAATLSPGGGEGKNLNDLLSPRPVGERGRGGPGVRGMDGPLICIRLRSFAADLTISLWQD